MEILNIPLSQMTFTAKFNLMEEIWDDISIKENAIKSPSWHNEILEDRENALLSGNAKISNWEEAKNRIKRNVACR